MKPAPLDVRRRGYRNDAVYRSAEHLVSTLERSRRPASKPLPRVANNRATNRVLVGLLFALLVAPTLLILERADRPVESSQPDLAGDTRLAGNTPVAKTPIRARGPATATTTTPSPNSTPARPTAPAGRSETSPTASYANSAGSLALAPDHAGTDAASRTPTTHAVVIVADEFTLCGELRSPSAPPISVEFALQVQGDREQTSRPIRGVIRFLHGDERLGANSVVGELTGDTITLRETSAIWTRGQLFQFGRRFVISLPPDRTSTPLLGTWSFGAAQGTLELALVRPW